MRTSSHRSNVIASYCRRMNFAELSFRDCPKSPRGVHNSALGATETMLFGPFWPPYTGHIHAQSVASTLFGQSLCVVGPKTGSHKRVLDQVRGARRSAHLATP